MNSGLAEFDKKTFDIIWSSRRISGHVFRFRQRKTNYYTCRACVLVKRNRCVRHPVPSIKLDCGNIIGNPEEGHFCVMADAQLSDVDTHDDAKQKQRNGRYLLLKQ